MTDDNPLFAPNGSQSHINISWAPELAERLVSGLPLTVLGQLSLPAPLAHVLVVGRADGGAKSAASLAATLIPGGNAAELALGSLGMGSVAGLLQPPPDITAQIATRGSGDTRYVLDDRGQDRFVMSPGVVRNQLVIACGTWPLLVPLFGPRATARPIPNVSGAVEELRAFAHVVSATIEAIYARQHLPVPRLNLVLRSTGASFESALDGLRQLGKSAAERVTRNPMDPPDIAPKRPRTRQADETPDVSFAEVGGQEEAKRELEAICLAIRDPDAYRRWGARPPRGVLLYGPPGTGKTLLARCLAAEARAPFIHVRATDITSKWYGEAEKRLQQAFDRARKESPAVLFFDEIDALARAREDAHEVTHRLVSTLLENMDGLDETQGVVVVAATNRPDALDPAIVRPGRFDRLVEVPLPDRKGRRAIFAVHLRKAERQAGRPLFAPIDDDGWSELVEATDGYNGAEIEETVRRALEVKVRAGARDGQIEVRDMLEQAATVTHSWS